MHVSTKMTNDIVGFYGDRHQMYKAAEELAELQTLVLQEANQIGKVDRFHIAEEIADVYVMLKQLELIYKFDDRDIQPFIDCKLIRTMKGVK